MPLIKFKDLKYPSWEIILIATIQATVALIIDNKRKDYSSYEDL